MSVIDHRVLQYEIGGGKFYYVRAAEQIAQLGQASIPELRAIVSDTDLAITVRNAADRRLRHRVKLKGKPPVRMGGTIPKPDPSNPSNPSKT